MAGEVIAWLEIRLSDGNPYDTHGNIEICGNEQFYLGRDTELCRYVWPDDRTISRQHLRVHCILYEQDPVAEIAPLVYATDLSANGTYLKKHDNFQATPYETATLMGQNVTVLLDNDDELRISDSITLIYRSKNSMDRVTLTPIQEREKCLFASRYLITGRLLGEGGYGKVHVGIHQATQQQLACKIIRLDNLYEQHGPSTLRRPTTRDDSSLSQTRKQWPTRLSNCIREFEILKDLSHPNIVALDKVFWSHDTIYMFQELVTGGDLFSFLEFKGGRLDDLQAAVIIRQVLKGVQYLHSNDIVHRDLKPDNILMTSPDDGARVVITDFGNARFLTANNSATALTANKYERMFSYVGTLEFTAPEIHGANRTIPAAQGYSRSVDMWSVGSITATILSGDVIFTDRTHPDYLKDPRRVIISLAAVCNLNILDEDYHPRWSAVGDRPKHFIKHLLVLDENTRLTASEALAHPWFSCYAGDFEDLYLRSVAEWKPRQQKIMVERISRSSASANDAMTKETSSHFSTSIPFLPVHQNNSQSNYSCDQDDKPIQFHHPYSPSFSIGSQPFHNSDGKFINSYPLGATPNEAVFTSGATEIDEFGACFDSLKSAMTHCSTGPYAQQPKDVYEEQSSAFVCETPLAGEIEL